MPVISFNGMEIPVRERSGPAGIEYSFPFIVPATDESVTVVANLRLGRQGTRTVVYVQGAPECLRHRFADGSLCMWFEPDASDRKWVLADGLDQLAAHVARHLFQEAVCRAGDPWPGEQAPGAHPRPRRCATCGGEGR